MSCVSHDRIPITWPHESTITSPFLCSHAVMWHTDKASHLFSICVKAWCKHRTFTECPTWTWCGCKDIPSKHNLMLGHRLRLWPNIKSTPGQCVVLAGYTQQWWCGSMIPCNYKVKGSYCLLDLQSRMVRSENATFPHWNDVHSFHIRNVK